VPGHSPGWCPVAHIHLPDGSFTLSWVLFWWLCALVLLGAALLRARVSRLGSREIAVAAFLTVAAFVAFLLEIPLFGGVHLNLTPLIGILAGPVLGTLVVLVTNILSAAIGHGGWGLIGANVLVNVSEVSPRGSPSGRWPGPRRASSPGRGLPPSGASSSGTS
jgi:cobalt/nickel transport system permease protein